MRTMLQAHRDWLTVVQMPAYAPDLNPVEGAWSTMKSSLGNLGSCGTPHRLAAIMKNRLKRIQYRPALIDGFLAQTGLSLVLAPPWIRPWPFSPCSSTRGVRSTGQRSRRSTPGMVTQPHLLSPRPPRSGQATTIGISHTFRRSPVVAQDHAGTPTAIRQHHHRAG